MVQFNIFLCFLKVVYAIYFNISRKRIRETDRKREGRKERSKEGREEGNTQEYKA